MTKMILFPTDGSATAKAAGRIAADIAKTEGDSVLVLVVSERADFGGMEDEAVTESIARYMEGVAKDAAAELERAGVSASPEVVIATKVDEAILEKAIEVDADMIVMGTHGRRGLSRAVIGSVADRVLRHSPVPVVLVPLKDEG